MDTLTTANIQKISALSLDKTAVGGNKGWGKSRPVFLAELTNGNKLVVKAELVNSNHEFHVQFSVRWGSKMMKQVSSDVHVHELSLVERQALASLPDSKFTDASPTTNVPVSKARQYLQELINALAAKKTMFAWFKMDFVDNLTHLQEMVEKGNGILALGILKDKDVMEKLGKIVAVDLFLNNSDRFRSDGTLGGANNIFLKQVQGGYDVVGLDFYNAGSSNANIVLNPKPNPAPNQQWTGHILNNDVQLNAFATACVKGINDFFVSELPKAKTPYNSSHLLSTAFSSPIFFRGLKNGRNDLQAYLKSKSVKILPGMSERVRQLNW